MNIQKLAELTEQLRKNIIGDPAWIPEKNVFEYTEQTIEVVIILKLLRAVQGLQSQILLCQAGLFVDMSALYRCVNDCTEEITFLLETYPEQSKHVQQFIKNFFEHTIDAYDSIETDSVIKQKIHSANVRYLTGQKINEDVRQKLNKRHKTFCGYIHANYSHIMQSYGGTRPNYSFNLLGVPSEQQKLMQSQIVKQSYISVLLCISLICIQCKEVGIRNEIKKLREEIKES